jgi:hypothetical protein
MNDMAARSDLFRAGEVQMHPAMENLSPEIKYQNTTQPINSDFSPYWDKISDEDKNILWQNSGNVDNLKIAIDRLKKAYGE